MGLSLWVGGAIFFIVAFGPAVNDLRPGIAICTLNRGRKSLEAISWTGISVLVITGLANLILREQSHPSGLSQFYIIALSIKLVMFGAMVYLQGLQVFKYGARISALTAEMAEDRVSWPEPLQAHWQKWFTLLKINATLGPIATILGLILLKT